MSDSLAPALLRSPGDAWARWEMAAFDVPARPSGPFAQEPASLPPELCAQIEQARRQAQAEGYAAGHAQGYAEGSQAGAKTGHEAGYKAGVAQGHAAGSEASREETEKLQTLLKACSQALESVQAEVGQGLITLAINIARQVVRSTVAAEPEKILDIVRDIFQAEPNPRDTLQMRLHPADLELIQTHLADDPALKHWRLLRDDTIECGGCIAETALGDIDATLQTRWRRVTSALGRDHPWNYSP